MTEKSKKALIARRTRRGLITGIYSGQRKRSRIRGHELPPYTNKELQTWVQMQPNFEKVYQEWIDSDYDAGMIPTTDRIDDSKGYTFDNMKISTLDENCNNYYNKLLNFT